MLWAVYTVWICLGALVSTDDNTIGVELFNICLKNTTATSTVGNILSSSAGNNNYLAFASTTKMIAAIAIDGVRVVHGGEGKIIDNLSVFIEQLDETERVSGVDNDNSAVICRIIYHALLIISCLFYTLILLCSCLVCIGQLMEECSQCVV